MNREGHVTGKLNAALRAGALSLLLAGCAPDQPPSLPSQTQHVELPASAYLSELMPLLNPTSEAELWNNVQKIHGITNRMYCESFPSCLNPNTPQLQILDTPQYAALVQSDDPNNSPIPPDQLDGALLTALRSGSIALNSGAPKVRNAIAAGSFSGVALEMPTFLVHERFHTDTVPASIEPWEINSGNGIVVKFDSVIGFGLQDTAQSIVFDYLEEAAAVVISKETQRRQLGTVLGQDMTVYGPYTRLLLQKMQENGISADTLVQMHRASNLDGFLTLVYPQEPDLIQRRSLLINQFDQAGKQ